MSVHFDILRHVTEVAHRVSEVPFAGSTLLVNIQKGIGALYQELLAVDLRLPHTHSPRTSERSRACMPLIWKVPLL